MLFATADILARGTLSDVPLKNAVLESFAIHTRNVLRFLYPHGDPDKAEIVASDFLPAELWEAKRPAKRKLLDAARQQANRQIAHLTYKRLTVTPKTKQWHFNEISREIYQAFQVFVSLAKLDWHLAEPTSPPTVSVESSTSSSSFMSQSFTLPAPNP